MLFQLESSCPGFVGSSVSLAAALSLTQQPLGDAHPFLSCCVVSFMAVQKTVWPCLLQILGGSCVCENWHGCEADLKQDDCFTCIHQSPVEGKSTRLLPAASDTQVILSADEIQGLSFIQFFPSCFACLQPSGLLGQDPGRVSKYGGGLPWAVRELRVPSAPPATQ